MREERWIRPCEIVLALGVALEWIERRLVVIVLIALGKDAHANLVERPRSQGLQRLLLEIVRLMDPRIASCSKRKERRAIGVGKMMRVMHRDRAVGSGERGNARELSYLP